MKCMLQAGASHAQAKSIACVPRICTGLFVHSGPMRINRNNGTYDSVSGCHRLKMPAVHKEVAVLFNSSSNGSASRRQAIATARVVPQSIRCVQCGICSYNCPMGLNVRAHAGAGVPISTAHCLSCGECVRRCPRGVLRLERLPLFGDQLNGQDGY